MIIVCSTPQAIRSMHTLPDANRTLKSNMMSVSQAHIYVIAGAFWHEDCDLDAADVCCVGSDCSHTFDLRSDLQD